MRFHCSASSVARKYSFKSMPADHASPEPVITTTPQRVSPSSVSSVASISALRSGLIALRFSGRLSATQATPSSNSTLTFLPQGSDMDLLSFCRVVDLDVLQQLPLGMEVLAAGH